MSDSPQSEIVAISNGFHKMHLATAAREASDRGLPSIAITGAYPTKSVRRIARLMRIADKGRVARLMERDEGIPGVRLHSLLLPEIVDEFARLFARAPVIGRLYMRMSMLTWHLYGRLAARKLRRARNAKIFHYRAGFGGASIDRARKQGMITLCDHALVHPSVLDALVERRGVLDDVVRPDAAANGVPRPSDPGSRTVLADIEKADAVVVNSDFVKETFLRLGWPAERIHVAYLGVDNNFLEVGPAVPQRVPVTGTLPLLFASRFERRKGAEVLIEALTSLDAEIDWDLVVAGPTTPEIERDHGGFFADPRVKVLGSLTRPDFKRQMIDRPVFVFPTFAEGSARAVFDAMACGCYVITTPNAGSVVQDGVHGALVPAGDAGALAAAIADADRNRERVAEIGNGNAALIATSYRQFDYGERLAALYNELVTGSGA